MCKNIVLSGVNSLTILDTRIVEERHSATNFLIRTATGKSFAGIESFYLDFYGMLDFWTILTMVLQKLQIKISRVLNTAQRGMTSFHVVWHHVTWYDVMSRGMTSLIKHFSPSETCVPNLQILNPLVKVEYVSEELNEETVKQYSVVCITGKSPDLIDNNINLVDGRFTHSWIVILLILWKVGSRAF